MCFFIFLNIYFLLELEFLLKKIISGRDVYNEQIKPKMIKAVINSLKSSQDMVGMRKNSCELFGYDFLIDETFKPWLIEINSSPSLEYSSVIIFEKKKLMIIEEFFFIACN